MEELVTDMEELVTDMEELVVWHEVARAIMRGASKFTMIRPLGH